MWVGPTTHPRAIDARFASRCGIHPAEPTAEAQNASRRAVGGVVRLLRRQLAENCRREGTATGPTHLVIGEGPGGTYYQSLDVTMADMAAVLGGTKPDSAATLAQVLSYFSSSSRITLNWAFPSYTSFNPALAPYGDVALAASAVEKSVGQTWSDPAVGPIFNSSGPYSVMLGSGFLPYSVQQQANRGSVIAGTTFYLLNVKDGAVYASQAVTTDGVNETNNDCRIDNGTAGCQKMKNALQTDPVATGPADSRFVTKSYIGDLGRQRLEIRHRSQRQQQPDHTAR